MKHYKAKYYFLLAFENLSMTRYIGQYHGEYLKELV